MADRPPPDGDFAIKHEIFVLDANLASPLDQTHMEPITAGLVQDLMKVLGLEALGKLEMYPAADLRAPGWSFIQPITTSHISAHYFEKPGNHPHIHLDIYSCDSVEWEQIVGVVHTHLNLTDWRATYLVRGWGGSKRLYLDLAGNGGKLTDKRELSPAHVTTSAASNIA